MSSGLGPRRMRKIKLDEGDDDDNNDDDDNDDLVKYWGLWTL